MRTLLYYAMIVYNTMLVVSDNLGYAQTKVTQKIMEALNQLLKYSETHPNARLWYCVNVIVLHIYRERSYLSAPKAFSIEGRFPLSSNITYPSKCKINGAIHVTSKIPQNIMVSAADTEIVAYYDNGT